MKNLKIKRSYYKETKKILKKIKPYTHDVHHYTIVINVKEDNPTYIQYYTVRWKEHLFAKDSDIHRIDVMDFWKDDIITEVIEALKLADKEVAILIETYP